MILYIKELVKSWEQSPAMLAHISNSRLVKQRQVFLSELEPGLHGELQVIHVNSNTFCQKHTRFRRKYIH